MNPVSLSTASLEAARSRTLAAAGGLAPSSRGAGRSEAVARAAGQFEAIILRQLLSPTIEPLMSGGLGGAGGSGGGVYGYMLTDVLANSLGAAGGLGLSKMLTQQLTPRGLAPAGETPDPAEQAGPSA